MTNSKALFILRAGTAVAVLSIGSAAQAQQAPAAPQDAALAYAQCMRDNGYAEFPDPTPEHGIQFVIAPGTAPRFEKAAGACRNLAAAAFSDIEMATKDREALLLISQCVRENGISDFPDPGSEGNFDLRGTSVAAPGNLRLEAAIATCKDRAGLSQDDQIIIGG